MTFHYQQELSDCPLPTRRAIVNCGTSFSNHKGITNLLSIPLLENLGYKVKIQPDEELVVITPNEKGIVCKRETSFAHCMPHIELREQHKEFPT